MSRARRSLMSVPVLAIGAALALVLPAQVNAAPSAYYEGPLHQESFSYGRYQQEQLDAYWHMSHVRQPGVLLIHGGYWVAGDKSGWAGEAQRLADRGYAVFAANYRLATQAPWPAQRIEMRRAVSFIKAHAGEFRLDPRRLAVLGSSAGGQLAESLGVLNRGPDRVRGVVALSPVSSPERAYRMGRTNRAKPNRVFLSKTAQELAGCGQRARSVKMRRCARRWHDMSAVSHVTAGAAPMLIFHSAGDLVPAANSAGLVKDLVRHRVRAELEVVGGTAHGAALLSVPGVQRQMFNWLGNVTRKRIYTMRNAVSYSSTPRPAATRRPAKVTSAGHSRATAGRGSRSMSFWRRLVTSGGA